MSLMHANNEVGVIQPLEKISHIWSCRQGYFHSDTVQTMGHYEFDLELLNIDLLVYVLYINLILGPKGIGFLYVNPKNHIRPQIVGGGQERGLRSEEFRKPSWHRWISEGN